MDLSGKRILVNGGSGFLGSQVPGYQPRLGPLRLPAKTDFREGLRRTIDWYVQKVRRSA